MTVEEACAMVAMTVGVDLAKSVFLVHGVDSSGRAMELTRFGGHLKA
jgi:hypothetical protein